MDKVVISGLTAAGKTTHTVLLSEALGFSPIHFTDLLLQELGVTSPSTGSIWADRLWELQSLRSDLEADRRVDRMIADLLASPAALVVDAALAPWLSSADALNIWLGSDRVSRAWKCSVSSLPAQPTTEQSIRLIDEKDSLTRQYLQLERGVDLYTDRARFDLVLDLSHLIAEPTRGAADHGIECFHEVLLACVECALHGRPDRLAVLLERSDPDQTSTVVMVGDRLPGLRHVRSLLRRGRPALASRIA